MLPCGCVSIFLDTSLTYITHRLRKSAFLSASPGKVWLERLCRNCHEEFGDIWNVMVFPLGMGGEGPRDGSLRNQWRWDHRVEVAIPEFVSPYTRFILSVGMPPADLGLSLPSSLPRMPLCHLLAVWSCVGLTSFLMSMVPTPWSTAHGCSESSLLLDDVKVCQRRKASKWNIWWFIRCFIRHIMVILYFYVGWLYCGLLRCF